MKAESGSVGLKDVAVAVPFANISFSSFDAFPEEKSDKIAKSNLCSSI